jgi:NAD(P)-dependent dehydrogenase (short-subunit alcohol dehydrogenase family)
MANPTPLSPRIVLITGGFRGLGRGLAQALLAHEATVVVTSRQGPQQLERPARVEPWRIHLDVTAEDSVQRCFRAVSERFGRLDVLVNNAGVGIFKSIGETTLSEWRDVLTTNLTGAFLCCRQAVALMATQGGGRIINIGSIADRRALPFNAAYGASKWGLRGLSAILAEECHGQGIRVSHVSLGAVHTEIWQGRDGFDPADMLPLDVAAAAIADQALLPLSARADELVLLPPKGVL